MSFVSAKACVCSKSPSVNRNQGNELAASQINHQDPISHLTACWIIELSSRVCERSHITLKLSFGFAFASATVLCTHCAPSQDIPPLQQGVLTLHSDHPEKVWLHKEKKS